jgi:hypothetical protein
VKRTSKAGHWQEERQTRRIVADLTEIRIRTIGATRLMSSSGSVLHSARPLAAICSPDESALHCRLAGHLEAASAAAGLQLI